MGTRYEIHEGYEYYDENECDARGYPIKKRGASEKFFESNIKPIVNDSWIFEKDGTLYQRRVVSIHSNGTVYEDTESLDVEYATREIKPDELIIGKIWVNQKPKFGVFNGRGKTVIAYEYDEIEHFNNHSTFKVRKGEKWGVLDCTDHSFKFPIAYDNIDYIGKNMMVRQGEKTSYFDLNYNEISLQLINYTIIEIAYDKLFIVEIFKKTSKDAFVGVLDWDGNVIIPLNYQEITCVSDGFLAKQFEYPTSRHPRKYLFDKKGKMRMEIIEKLNDILENETEINGEMYDLSAYYYISIPDSITRISGGALSYYKNLQSVTIGKNVAYISSNTFLNCPNLISISVDKENPYFSSEDGVLFDKKRTTIIKFPPCKSVNTFVIPKSVEKISRSAFDNTSIQNIIMPNGLKEIEDFAFSKCNFIKAVYIPNSVTSIGKWAFYGCKSLESIKLPDTLRYILDYTFDDCPKLANIQFPNKLESIGHSTFKGCTQLISLSFPDTIQEIGNSAFENCTQLKSISFPDTIQEIGDFAFQNCSNLKSISLPNSVCKISKYAFVDCNQLETIIMPKTIQNWNDLFFPYWKKYSANKILTTLETYEDIKFSIPSTVYVELLPESLENIRKGKHADSVIEKLPISESDWNKYRDVILSNCKGVREAFSGPILLYCNSQSYFGLSFDKYAIYGDYAFAHCELLRIEIVKTLNEYCQKKAMEFSRLTIPDSVQSIGKGAFMGCTLLVDVTIPESVTHLGDEAFKDCINLRKVTIPHSLSWIGINTFKGCNSLETVVISRKLYKKSKWKFPDTTEFQFYEK